MHQRKRCWILTASPASTSMRATCAGKVELRISIVCGPGGTSSTRSGGLRPRLLPSTSTSPQGATASSRRPGPRLGRRRRPSPASSRRAATIFFGACGAGSRHRNGLPGRRPRRAPPPRQAWRAVSRGCGAAAAGSPGIRARAPDAAGDDQEENQRRGGERRAAQPERAVAGKPARRPARVPSVRAAASSTRRGRGVAPTTA